MRSKVKDGSFLTEPREDLIRCAAATLHAYALPAMIALEARQGEALARVLLPSVLAAGGLLGRGVEIWCSLDLPE